MRNSNRTTGTTLAGPSGTLTLAATLLFLTGCGFLSPTPDTSRYFMLRSAPVPAAGPAPLGELVLGLGPVDVPAYLDQNEMLDLVGPYEVTYSEQNRWVEPLGGQIFRTLADNLHNMLGPDAILPFPWYTSDGVDLAVEVSFDPIRLDSSGAWLGGASWTLRDPDSRAALERSSSDFVLGTGSIAPQDVAERLSEELGRMGSEIAEAVRRQYVP